MAGVFSKAKRSAVMARIRGQGNKDTELALASAFRRHGITGWRRHQPVFGKPDFVFSKLRLAVFVDGCFWHACPVHATKPGNNAAFWRKKLATNQARDRKVNRALRAAGWRVLRIWEHELSRWGTRNAESSGAFMIRDIRFLIGERPSGLNSKWRMQSSKGQGEGGASRSSTLR